MGAIKSALTRSYVGVFASAGLQTLYSDIVPPDQIWCVQRLAFEGNLATSGGNTRARYYADRSGVRQPLAEQDAPVADTLYWDADPFWLCPGDKLALEWDQGQASTTLKMHLRGYWTEAKEGIV